MQRVAAFVQAVAQSRRRFDERQRRGGCTLREFLEDLHRPAGRSFAGKIVNHREAHGVGRNLVEHSIGPSRGSDAAIER